MVDSPFSWPKIRAQLHQDNVDKAVELLTAENGSNPLLDVLKALALLGAAHNTSDFYPAMNPFTKDLVDPALIAGLMRLETEHHQREFISGLERAGLPVIRFTGHDDVVAALGRAGAAYGWTWDTPSSPQALTHFLTDKKIADFQEMCAYWGKGWWFTGTTDALIWSAISPENPPIIKKAGVRIVVTSHSMIIGVPGESLTFKNVAIRPFIEPGTVQRTSPLSGEKRHIVTISKSDRIIRGYSR